MFNKWIIGGVAFLIVLSVACVLWYQHDTAADRQAAAEAEKLLRQWELSQETDTDSETEQAADVSMESETPTAEKPVTEKPVTETPDRGTEGTEVEIQAQTDAETQAENAEATDVPVSPHGFGPYPEVPEDMPFRHLYTRWEKAGPQRELLNRVLIKLWASGEKNFVGGSTYNGKIYPHYNDVVYVSRKPYIDRNGNITGYKTRTKSGPHVNYTDEDILDPPPHLRILDLDSSGIDPYQYLDLP